MTRSPVRRPRLPAYWTALSLTREASRPLVILPVGNLAKAIAPAPAQDVPGMFSAPTVKHPLSDPQVSRVLAAFPDERPQVVLRTRRGTGRDAGHPLEGLRVHDPAGRDRARHPGRGAPPLAAVEVVVYRRDPARVAARGEVGAGQSASLEHGRDRFREQLRPEFLEAETGDMRLGRGLVHVVTLARASPHGKYDRYVEISLSNDLEYIEPVEMETISVVIPGKVHDHQVESRCPFRQCSLYRPRAVRDAHSGAIEPRSQERLDQRSARCGQQDPAGKPKRASH